MFQRLIYLIVFILLFSNPNLYAEFEFVYNRPPESNNIDAKTLTFINQATTSLDIAIFQLSNAAFVDEIISAKNRGVNVRMVTESENWNACMEQLSGAAGIKIIPDNILGGGSGFMHDKFIIRDGNAVLTGTYNFTDDQTYDDKNSIIIVKNAASLAAIYQAEFNQMFVNKKFGTAKVPLTATSAVVDGITFEVYFSPKGNITSKLVNAINTTNSNLYFSIFTFTDQSIADAIKNARARGCTVKGVFDSWNADGTYSKDEYLEEADCLIGRDAYKGLLHDKIMAIDGGTSSDPLGIIGSFNFTGNANTSNDENILIIHNSSAANSIKANIVYVFNNQTK